MPRVQPGEGRIVMPSRFADEKKQYVFQPYPSHRFHPDGREVIVQNEEDEQERCPASDGWGKTPFPVRPRPQLVAEPEETAAELKLIAQQQRETFQRAFKQLSNEHDRLGEYSAEQSGEILQLRQQLTHAQEQIRALTTPAGEPPATEEVPAEAPNGKKKK